ncbi:MAG: hypothetical protein WCZ23_08075 [Rhodospirillaceae bacterium]
MKRQGPGMKAVADFLRHLPRGSRIALGIITMTAVVALGALPFAFSAVDEAEAALRRLRAETNQTRGQAQQAALDYAYVQDNSGRYKDALARGVLDEQDRLAARQRMDELMNDAYLVRMAYEMAAAESKPGPGGYQIVSTPIKMEVASMLDRDIFVLLQSLETAFPGYGVVRGFRIARQDPVTEDALRRVTAGEPVPFLTGTVTFDWRSAQPPAGATGGAR